MLKSLNDPSNFLSFFGPPKDNGLYTVDVNNDCILVSSERTLLKVRIDGSIRPSSCQLSTLNDAEQKLAKK